MSKVINRELYLYAFAPKTISLLALAGTWAVGFLENEATEQLTSAENKLKVWVRGFNINAKLFPSLSILSSIMGYLAYRKTGQSDYLWGSVAVLSIIPITFAILQPINKRLLNIDFRTNVEHKELANGQSKQIQKGIRDWVSCHRIRIAAILVAIGFFYSAETKTLKR